MAYAALTSLLQTLEKIPQPAEQIIASFKEQVACLLGIIEDSSPKRSLTITNLEGQIRDAAYDAEDFIESHFQTFNFEYLADLQKIFHEFDSILEALSSKTMEGKAEDDLRMRDSSSTAAGSSTSPGEITDLVGLDEDLLQLKDRLTGSPSNLDIISILGTGGIGKTTLARNLYNDSLIKGRFDIRAWVVASQEYNIQQILKSLLEYSTTSRGGDYEFHKKSTGQLAELLYKSLKGRRYLIVMDDVWDTKAWDDVARYFPNDNNGSRIILTTRLSEVAIYVNGNSPSIHHMRLLSSEASWNVLSKKVFGEEQCPISLKKIGKKIADNCKGLPLAIVVIGGLLSKATRKPRYWEHIAQNVKSAITESDDEFMEILSLSYNYLPCHLKACFLYMGVFPENHVIFVSHLIKLWIAEGFIKPHTSKSLEDVAEDYLNDLVDRSLLMIHKRKYNGGIKTCMIHDMLRGLSIKQGKDEKFLHVMDSEVRNFPEGKDNQRRVSIQSDALYRDAKVHANLCVRSILCFHFSAVSQSVSLTMNCRMLRVLDTLTIRSREFPKKLVGLDHLRYLAFNYGGRSRTFPSWIFELEKLQILIVFGGRRDNDTLNLDLGSSIWKMSQIRHLVLDMCFLPYPFTEYKFQRGLIILENLQTLSEVKNFSCTRELFEIMPNLKKLGLSYSKVTRHRFQFNNFVYLHQLETLKIRFIKDPPSVNFAFPPTLKKLTLSRCQNPWENMTIIGSLPNLEVLKLKDHAFRGSVWEPDEGEFKKLKFLLISESSLEHWRANNTHFPLLQRLRLSYCSKLVEIPSEIGDIPTLEFLELYESSPSAMESAMIIQAEQQSLENNLLKVITSKYFHDHLDKYSSLGKMHRDAAISEHNFRLCCNGVCCLGWLCCNCCWLLHCTEFCCLGGCLCCCCWYLTSLSI